MRHLFFSMEIVICITDNHFLYSLYNKVLPLFALLLLCAQLAIIPVHCAIHG